MDKQSLNSYLYRMIRCINQDNIDQFYQVLDQLITSKQDKPGELYKTLKNLYNNRPRRLDILSSDKELENLVSVLTPERKDLILSISERYDEIIKEHQNKDLFYHHNLPITNKLLLYGNPGLGKTRIAHNLAFDLNLPFVQVNNAQLVSSKLGSTSSNIGHIMKLSQPCLLFFDEIDSIALSRDSTKNEHSDINRALNVLLIEIEKMSTNVIFVAATNRYDFLDPAIIRRFDDVLKIEAPDNNQKKVFIKKLNQDHNMELTSELELKILMLNSYSDIEKMYIKEIRKQLISTLKL